MRTNLSDLKGFSFFETVTEKERIQDLSQLAEELTPSEKIQFVIPNMVKDAEGKIKNAGFFLFFETIIYEFRNFLNTIDFDFAKWDEVSNIRMGASNYKFDKRSGEIPSVAVKFFHGSSSHDFCTEFTVFGEPECNYVFDVIKQVSKNLV